MANVVSVKKVKIKPEDSVVAQGPVVDVRYAGSTRIGIGPFAKTVHIWKVFVGIEGLPKPLVVRVKEDQGMNLAVVDDMKAIGKMFSKKPAPIEVGAVLTVEYNARKPKKANVVESNQQA